MSQNGEILTIGHSNHEERSFIELLRGAGIELIADVRANPRSRYPQFNRAALVAELDAAGINYVHLGGELGGRREPVQDSPNAGWDVEPFQGYADHMATPEFEAGLARLEELARDQRTAVMCAEGDWTRCHRRLLADMLSVGGWDVLHLLGDGSTEEHPLTDFAVVADGRLTYPEQQTSLDV